MSLIEKIYQIDLDIKVESRYEPMEFIQGDTLNKIIFKISNSGKTFSLNQYVYRIILERPDGVKVKKTPKVDNERLIYNLGTTEIEKAGTVVAYMEIYDGPERITTKSFNFKVVKSMNNGGLIESETEYPVISQVIGDGLETQFYVTHNRNTLDVIVSIRTNQEPYEIVYADMTIIDPNTVLVTFAQAPATNQYKIIIIG
ncbi:BppU family phage baseplate upper protein [Ruminiclostridium cellobioparum]|uniref:BppU family phage baseplate upper protein n=1 Tax=Ruminiclostridium cellobioparum TaxID=29355 RepID=UPI0004854225|nr:BppU family phage baseplate upper protein [Ruminiclostridium cellobioparum]